VIRGVISGFDVSGPVQAEVFVLRMADSRIRLSDDWKRVLSGYVPEPFRHIG
jgi:hypothetical protein